MFKHWLNFPESNMIILWGKKCNNGNSSTRWNDEDLCLLFMNQDLLVCVLCYGVLGPHIKFVTLIFQWLVFIN